VMKAKKVSFPGFERVPIYYVLQFFFKELKDDRINMRASSVAFYFLLALFPGIIFFFTLIPYIPIDNFQEILFNNLRQVMPETAFSFLQGAIADIIRTERVDLLSVGFILAFLFSTNGVHALAKTFDKSHDLFRKRSFIAQRLTDIKLTAVLFFLLVLAVAFIVMGNQLINFILNTVNVISAWQILLLNLFRWVIILLVFFLGISFIYYYAPATRKKFRFVSIGSMVATLLTVAASLLFSYVVNNFNLYNEIYGSIGALIAILLWLYINCFALIIGFELNTSVKYLKLSEQNDKG
jgi:membrane protein